MQYDTLRRACALAAIVTGTLAQTFATDAQETTNTPSATMPGKGRLFTAQRITSETFDATPDGRTITDLTFATHIAYGIDRDLAVTAHVPFRLRTNDRAFTQDDDAGFADAHIGLRYRFLQRDLGPVDTLRMATDVRLELPTGSNDFSSDSIDPHVGLNLNYIKGRQGFNAHASWKFTTGDVNTPLRAGETLSDSFMLNGAYVYRINPAEFDAKTTGATYLQLELLTHGETNGNTGVDIAPGLLYEGQRFAAEASLILPVFDDLSGRPDARTSFLIGVRFLF